MQDDGLKWLHKSSVVVDGYNPDLLESIPRSIARQALSNTNFFGYDVWQAYEVSYLMPSGCLKVATLTFQLDAHSECVVESKSLKLYLNSLNNHVFNGEQALYDTIKQDLTPILGTSFELSVAYPPFSQPIPSLKLSDWDLLEDTNIEHLQIPTAPNADTLELIDRGEHVSEHLATMLFRANCLVTNQPDWATVMISYDGLAWYKNQLLAYLISYRNHQGFHEQCADRMYADIMTVLKPKSLVIQANFMRRGGIDITPVRSSHQDFKFVPGRDWRQ